MSGHDDNAEGRVTTSRAAHLLEITIDRPAKLNGFTPKMLVELSEAYTELERDESLRVGILSAAGPHFTAGLDLPKVAPLIKAGKRHWAEGGIDPLDLSAPRRTKPMVVAVKGITYTIGIELLLAPDISVAASDCRFSQLEVRRGIMAAGGACARMVERAGWGHAMLHLLTGDEFDAETALRCNFVQEVVAPGEELPRARLIAERIAEQAPLAVHATLASARSALERGFEQSFAAYKDINMGLSETEDAAEGVASFVEKRPTVFQGR